MWADQALERFLPQLEPNSSILDVGSGEGNHARILRAEGHTVQEIDWARDGDYNQIDYPPGFFDAIWCSHVLEHQPNVGLFLQKLRRELKPGGLLALTVPPAKFEIVGGHLTIWNAGLLLYNLVVAGWDCRAALVGAYNYNISVIVRRVDAKLPRLHYDQGDIELLAEFFPVRAYQGFNGNITRVGWDATS